MRAISVCEIRPIGFQSAWDLQRRLVRERQSGRIDDVVLIVEHTPVVTLGRNARREDVLASHERMTELGIEIAECDRGGEVTFHGPGQLVGYPIIDLHQCNMPPDFARLRSTSHGLGPVDYVRALEEVLIRAAAELGVPSRRVPGLTGVWTAAEPSRKLAAIGVHVSRGVTSHGFALNVSTDLRNFQTIVPCGIHDREVTSLQRELGAAPAWDQVRNAVLRQFGIVFGRQIVWVDRIEVLLPPEDMPATAPPELRELLGERTYLA